MEACGPFSPAKKKSGPLCQLGYPCIRRTADEQTVKTCQLKNATDDRLAELVDRNLRCLRDVLEYNVSHGIRFFRIHSDTIPFADHPDVNWDWETHAEPALASIGEFIRSEDIRISMHPGQYTVLNSPDPDVVEKARKNLHYHARFLQLMGLDQSAKIVLHIGGVYGDRERAARRFVDRAKDLSDLIQNHLVIENDETGYNVKHVLCISEQTGLPVVYDDLHHRLNQPSSNTETKQWITRCAESWTDRDGPPILHFSSPSGGSGGHHADRVDPGEFWDFLNQLPDDQPVDVMLECKDKESALFDLVESLDYPFRETTPRDQCNSSG